MKRWYVSESEGTAIPEKPGVNQTVAGDAILVVPDDAYEDMKKESEALGKLADLQQKNFATVIKERGEARAEVEREKAWLELAQAQLSAERERSARLAEALKLIFETSDYGQCLGIAKQALAEYTKNDFISEPNDDKFMKKFVEKYSPVECGEK